MSPPEHPTYHSSAWESIKNQGSAQPASSRWTGARECGSLEAVVAMYGAAAPEAAARLPVATAPRTHKKHPFVFFHQRKTGGSTIRTQMVYSAKKHSLSSWVPCSNRVPCESCYAPPHLRPSLPYTAAICTGRRCRRRCSGSRASTSVAPPPADALLHGLPRAGLACRLMLARACSTPPRQILDAFLDAPYTLAWRGQA